MRLVLALLLAVGALSPQSIIVVKKKAAGGSIAFVSSISADNFNNSDGNITTGSFAVTQGNLIVTACGSRLALPQVPTDSAGNTYTERTSAQETANNTYLHLYRAIASTTESITITCRPNTTGYVSVLAMQFSGQNVSPDDQVASTIDFNSGNATITSSSFTPTNAGAVAVACAFTRNASTTYTAGSGYTLGESPTNSTGRCEYKLEVGTAAQTASMTLSPNPLSKVIAVGTFKP